MLTVGDESLQEIGGGDRHLFLNHFSAERLRLPFYPKFFFLLYLLVQQKFKRLKLMQHMEEPFPSWSKLVVLVETFRKVGNSENQLSEIEYNLDCKPRVRWFRRAVSSLYLSMSIH